MPSDVNRRVAEACGIEVWEEMSHAGKVLMRAPAEHEKYDRRGIHTMAIEFAPAMFPQDAVLAAEKFGLFDNGNHECDLRRDPEEKEWRVVGYGGEVVGFGGTFCEAICAAILRLADKGPEALRKDHNE